MTETDRKMKVISSCLVPFYTEMNESFFAYYKVEKHKNICHLQQNACNSLADK